MSAAGVSHDPKLSPTYRLDEYIRSFEARYGVVPIEAKLLNDSLASVSSISLEASVRRDPTPGPCVWTPRFPGEATGGPLFDHFPLSNAVGSFDGTTHATVNFLSETHHTDAMRSPLRPMLRSSRSISQSDAWPCGPCAKPDRGRASSNPPELKLEGPRQGPQGPRFERRAPLRRSYGRDDFAHPLPAPRGTPPPACNSFELMARPMLSSDRGSVRLAPRLPRPLAATEDEVNCQSPVQGVLSQGPTGGPTGPLSIPRPSKLLASEVQGARSARCTRCEAAVQTEAEFSSPLRLLELQQKGSPTEVTVQSTPDFGEVKFFSEPLRGLAAHAHLGYATLEGNSSQSFGAGYNPGSAPVSRAKFIAGSEQDNDYAKLKQRLQNALARGLNHLTNLQALTMK